MLIRNGGECVARKRKGPLSCLLSLLPHDPYQKCEREGGWDVYILHNGWSLFSFEPVCVCILVYLDKQYY